MVRGRCDQPPAPAAGCQRGTVGMHGPARFMSAAATPARGLPRGERRRPIRAEDASDRRGTPRRAFERRAMPMGPGALVGRLLVEAAGPISKVVRSGCCSQHGFNLTPRYWSWDQRVGSSGHRHQASSQGLSGRPPGGAEADPPLAGGPTTPPGAWVSDSQAATASCGRG
jgi:hypothetical protein